MPLLTNPPSTEAVAPSLEEEPTDSWLPTSSEPLNREAPMPMSTACALDIPDPSVKGPLTEETDPTTVSPRTDIGPVAVRSAAVLIEEPTFRLERTLSTAPTRPIWQEQLPLVAMLLMMLTEPSRTVF